MATKGATLGLFGNLARGTEDLLDGGARIAAEKAAEEARIAAEKLAQEQAAEAVRLAAEAALAKAAEEAAEVARLAAEQAAKEALEQAALETARLAAEKAARNACTDFDALCKVTRAMGVENTWHFPQWIQNAVEYGCQKTGFSGNTVTGIYGATIGLTLGTLGYFALRKKREDLAQCFCNELCQAVTADADAVNALHALRQEKDFVAAVNGLSKERAGELGQALKQIDGGIKTLIDLGPEGRLSYIQLWNAGRDEAAKAAEAAKKDAKASDADKSKQALTK
jgi:hypothetical protein